MKIPLTLLFLFLSPPVWADADVIHWLVLYDGKSPPAAPWTLMGKANASFEDGVLRLSDDSKEDMGAYEAEWNGDLDGKEIIVEARVKLGGMIGHRDSPTATWPQRDGAPICIQVSDGRHQEGILLTPAQETHPEAAKGYVRTLTDRFAQTDTRDAFHTYRLIIRAEDMAVEMDGKRVIAGRDASMSPRGMSWFSKTAHGGMRGFS